MTGKPGPPDPSADQGGAGADEPTDDHYGPLELSRLRKDDGRALIVYRRDSAGRPGAEGE